MCGNATEAALDDGAQPGCEAVAIDGTPANRWLEAKCAALRDTLPFSTDHHAFAFACGAGLSARPGTKLELGLVDAKGGRRKVALRCVSNDLPRGPAVMPAELETGKDLAFGKLPSGFGYVHVSRCREDLPAQIDAALAEVGGCQGLVLDFRGNSGGGFDHPALMGRFVPKGETLIGGVRYESAGPSPYGGPVVVIVDAHVVSAGETASGIFKEDGRAYMIGESPTAGMSSQKKRIELPSGLFGLYVSTGSNKGRFNEGKGIEGIGVVPHEVVPLDPKLASQGVDTWIKRAEDLLADFPKDEVRFRAR
jgi:C-terminal processing protease CtpA/Prc